jgi:hypothetical protein
MQTVSNVVNDDQSYGVLMWQRQFTSPCGRHQWLVPLSGNGGNVVLIVPLKSLVGGRHPHALQPARHAR